MESLKDAVDEWANEPDNTDRVLEVVSKHGVYGDDTLDTITIDTPDKEANIAVSPDIPEEYLESLTEFVKEYNPKIKECYANAVELCMHDERYDLIEGVTAGTEGRVHNHAWNSVGEYEVDVTRGSRERYGVRIPNEVVREYYPVLDENNRWDFISNPNIPDEVPIKPIQG